MRSVPDQEHAFPRKPCVNEEEAYIIDLLVNTGAQIRLYVYAISMIISHLLYTQKEGLINLKSMDIKTIQMGSIDVEFNTTQTLESRVLSLFGAYVKPISITGTWDRS